MASNNAVVLVVIVGISPKTRGPAKLFSMDSEGKSILKTVDNINGYLISGPDSCVEAISKAEAPRATMQFGNHPYYGTALITSIEEAKLIEQDYPSAKKFIRPVYGSQEIVKGLPRACFWIKDDNSSEALEIASIAEKVAQVSDSRLSATKDKAAQKLAATPWRFREQIEALEHTLVVPRVSSCNRQYMPCGIISSGSVVTSEAFALYDAPIWNLAVLSSRLHILWIAAVCGKFGPSFRYSNTLGWNAFPLPMLTEKNKEDLTRCAEEILLAREAHFPATIADLYDPENMPDDLRRAHDRNDEVLERIYIGRRFKNDTERLEKLFDLYTKMTAESGASKKSKKAN